MTTSTSVTGLKFALIYVDELEPTQKFYEQHLGFEKTHEFRPGEIYGKAGQIEIWIGSGYTRTNISENSTRAAMMIGVESVGSLHQSLLANGEKIVQDQPIEMQPGTFWLQFFDPAGNIIEVLGGK